MIISEFQATKSIVDVMYYEILKNDTGFNLQTIKLFTNNNTLTILD